MARESVGDTLRALHRALRPGGILLDIHPEPGHGRIQVRIGRKIHSVGTLDDSAYIGDIHAGRAVIASLIREGVFGRGREVRFRDVLHATDVDAWLAFREERSSRSILEPGLVPKVRDLMATGDGEILVVHRAYAGQVIRLGGASET